MANIQFQRPTRGKRICCFPIFVAINPLARPRLNKHTGSIWQPKTRQAPLLDALKYFKKPGIDYPFLCDLYIHLARRNNDESDWPTAPKYGDDDNLRKSVMDAMTDVGIIKDDRFCMGGSTYMCFDKEDFAFIELFKVEGIMNYESDS